MSANDDSIEKLLTLADGRTLAYADGGVASSKIVVLFLTGALSVGRVSRLPASLQAKGVHYIAPTLPGYGNTSPAPNNQSYAVTISSDMSFLLSHLHPDDSNYELYISGGSFGTVPTQMLYGAPFEIFPQGRYIKGMLLLGSFPPLIDDKEAGFAYKRNMSWLTYLTVGPPFRILPFRLLQRLMIIAFKSKLSSQESAEAFIRQFLFDKMNTEEKELYKAWRERTGYEEGRLEREIAETNRTSVSKSWEGFLSTPKVLNSDWGWGRKLGDLDDEHTVGRNVLFVAAAEDDATPIAWSEYLVTKYANARLKVIPGGHISAIFSLDEIWDDFFAA